MRLALLALLIGGAAATAGAQPAKPVDDPKVNQLIVYGDDQCPVSSFDEITVCARLPEDERFRIPPSLRDSGPANESWALRAQALEYVGLGGIGSCSPVGPGGGVGCLQQLIRQARAERDGSDEVNWTRLVEEARRERLSKIDAASEEVERQLREEQP